MGCAASLQTIRPGAPPIPSGLVTVRAGSFDGKAESPCRMPSATASCSVVRPAEQLHVANCGVRMGWLRAWAAQVTERLGPGATTAAVVEEIVRPDTRDKRCRYTQILEASDVGPPQFFLSHTCERPGHTCM